MTVRVLQGDCRNILTTLPDNSVQCVVTSPPYFGLRKYLPDGHADAALEMGSEPTPDAFIAALVAVFREVRRVLRDDGTLWLNLGDSYANDAKWGGSSGGKHVAELHGNTGIGRMKVATGAKPKDLLMMPARLALALQADGWWLRSDIIWHKPNPMPESVTDRPTSAHEHVFLLTKSANYFWDAEAVAEPALQPAGEESRTGQGKKDLMRAMGTKNNNGTSTSILGSNQGAATRNCRSVWTIATAPYSEAHFATFPPALAERCIRAGTSERGCCAACGAPWERMVERKSIALRPNSDSIRGHCDSANRSNAGAQRGAMACESTTTGWRPTCAHDAAVVPCTVLDCFAGAFTAPMVADRLQRNAIGIELSEEYCTMACDRLIADAGMFAELT